MLEILEVRQLVCLDIMLTTIFHAYFILGVDFVGGKYKTYILPGSTDRCINITILNDNIALEENENFAVEIAMASVPSITSTAEIIITDSNGGSLNTLTKHWCSNNILVS